MMKKLATKEEEVMTLFWKYGDNPCKDNLYFYIFHPFLNFVPL